jgi:hypothetical protein
MRYYAILPFLIFFTQHAFAQFKNTYAPNGNPTTQIIDASGMKQGNWNYYDTDDRIYRIESYTDHVLTKSIYLLNGSEISMMNYQSLQLSELSPKAIDFITKKLQTIGSGELILLQDGSVHLHFYLNKLKTKIPSDLSLEPVKQLALKNSIIKF